MKSTTSVRAWVSINIILSTLVVLTFIFTVDAYAVPKKTELTTYYPAPYGEYNELLLAPKTASTCDAARKGAMYYDDITLKLNICDGTAWKSVGGAGGSAPAGAVVSFAMSTPPTGWLECNGASVLSTAYPDLFAAIGTTYGTSTNLAGDIFFNLPDYQGMFLRGWNHNKTGAWSDPNAGSRFGGGNVVGSRQQDQFKFHQHKFEYDSDGNDDGSRSNLMQQQHGNEWWWTENTGGSETRPKNVYVMYCIKT